MIVIPGIAIIIFLAVYVFVSVLLLSIMHEDLDKDVSRVGFLLTAPIVIVAGMLSAMTHTRGAYWAIYKATVKRIPGDKVRQFVKSVRERHHSWMGEVKSLKREVAYKDKLYDQGEAEVDRRAHRRAESVLNQHWLDATVKVREALSTALTEACRIATEKADKSESEALEAMRERAEAAEEMAQTLQLKLARDRVHVRTPGGEQGL